MKPGIVAMPVTSVAEVPLRAIAAASALSLRPLAIRPDQRERAVYVTSFVRTAVRDTVRDDSPCGKPVESPSRARAGSLRPVG